MLTTTTYTATDTHYDLYEALKDVGSYNRNHKYLVKSDLTGVLDRFLAIGGSLGWSEEEAGDLAIYIAHRCLSKTRDSLAEELDETPSGILSIIKRVERKVKTGKYMPQLFDLISLIEGCGACYPTHLRPHFTYTPETHCAAVVVPF